MTDPQRDALHALARAAQQFLSLPLDLAHHHRGALAEALMRVGPLDDRVLPSAPNDDAPVTVDYTIRFCEQFADLMPDELTWIERNLRPAAEWEAFVDGLTPSAGHRFSDLHVLYARGDAFPEFDWRVEHDVARGRRLLVWTNTFGNADHVADFAEAFLARFRPTAVFTLVWVETCSTPRPGAFGGGAIVVTAKGREYLALSEWLEARRDSATAPMSACDAPAA